MQIGPTEPERTRRCRPAPARVALPVSAITGGRPSSIAEPAELPVAGPEVVAPFADAVGLVDREQIRAG